MERIEETDGAERQGTVTTGASTGTGEMRWSEMMDVDLRLRYGNTS